MRADSTGLVQAWLPSLGRHDKGTNLDLDCTKQDDPIYIGMHITPRLA